MTRSVAGVSHSNYIRFSFQLNSTKYSSENHYRITHSTSGQVRQKVSLYFAIYLQRIQHQTFLLSYHFDKALTKILLQPFLNLKGNTYQVYIHFHVTFLIWNSHFISGNAILVLNTGYSELFILYADLFHICRVVSYVTST